MIKNESHRADQGQGDEPRYVQPLEKGVPVR